MEVDVFSTEEFVLASELLLLLLEEEEEEEELVLLGLLEEEEGVNVENERFSGSFEPQS